MEKAFEQIVIKPDICQAIPYSLFLQLNNNYLS